MSSRKRVGSAVLFVMAVLAGVLFVAPAAIAAAPPDLGPNVLVFDPSMSTATIQAAVDAVATQQVPNQFGPQRYALLFEPGVYGSAADPLNFQVGYYTSVAGLGSSPGDVTINGSVYVRNQCDANGCVALNNFWRSLSNLTINVTTPNFGCYTGEFWAVSQASPMRRVNVTGGNVTLMDYCTGPSFASGGFIADSQTGFVINGSQQQFLVRNSSLGGWSNGVWNQVFSGVHGAPAECFPASGCGGPYTTLAASPVTREAPYLDVDAGGAYSVFVPSVQHGTSGASWSVGPTPGRSLPIDKFFVAKPTDSASTLNGAVNRGLNLLFTPGVYHLEQSININRSDTVVLGLGFATLVPDNGTPAIKTGPGATGVMISGLIFDAGAVNSPVLLQIGNGHAKAATAADPTTLSDVFFRIGGATPGSATTALVVNSNDVILDDIWAWRADHGNGVGWNSNTSNTGVVVNGDNVTAYGLFVEHFQKSEVIWNGDGGRVVFFQNEMPYDVPSQAAWMSSPTVKGYPALAVGDGATTFNGYGMGSYSFFNQGIEIYADNAFAVPSTLPAGSLHDLLTIFLDPTNGHGGILNVVNGTGGSSTVANPDTPVTVVNYP